MDRLLLETHYTYFIHCITHIIHLHTHTNIYVHKHVYDLMGKSQVKFIKKKNLTHKNEKRSLNKNVC